MRLFALLAVLLLTGCSKIAASALRRAASGSGAGTDIRKTLRGTAGSAAREALEHGGAAAAASTEHRLGTRVVNGLQGAARFTAEQATQQGAVLDTFGVVGALKDLGADIRKSVNELNQPRTPLRHPLGAHTSTATRASSLRDYVAQLRTTQQLQTMQREQARVEQIQLQQQWQRQ